MCENVFKATNHVCGYSLVPRPRPPSYKMTEKGLET